MMPPNRIFTYFIRPFFVRLYWGNESSSYCFGISLNTRIMLKFDERRAFDGAAMIISILNASLYIGVIRANL